MTEGIATSARRLGLALLCGALVWLFVCVNLFCFPQPPPEVFSSDVDAVVVLGGASAERLPAAQSLRERLPRDTVLVLSVTSTRANAAADALCDNQPSQPGESINASAALICFRPDPRNTRGEAGAVRDLVISHGWQRIMVVTSGYHVPRAGELMAQCVPAEVQMVGTTAELTPWRWLRRFVIETGGLLDVELHPECG